MTSAPLSGGNRMSGSFPNTKPILSPSIISELVFFLIGIGQAFKRALQANLSILFLFSKSFPGGAFLLFGFGNFLPQLEDDGGHKGQMELRKTLQAF